MSARRHTPDTYYRRPPQAAPEDLPLFACAQPSHEPCMAHSPPSIDDGDQDDYHALVAALRPHQGPDHAITAIDLARAAGIFPAGSRQQRDARVRALFRQYADQFPYVYASGGTGFYVAEDASQAAATMRNLGGRADGLLRRIERYLHLIARHHPTWLDGLPTPAQIRQLRGHLGSVRH